MSKLRLAWPRRFVDPVEEGERHERRVAELGLPGRQGE